MAGGNRPRLEAVSLEIRAETTVVLGYSGAGKTSLLNLLVGFEFPSLGRIHRHLEDQKNAATKGTPSASRLPLFWVPPDNGLWPHWSVAQHVREVAASGVDWQELLTDFDLVHLADARPDQLSQGEQSRLAIARGLATRARVLVLDEPLVHVDPARISQYWTVLEQAAIENGTTLIVATHSPELAMRLCGRILCLRAGSVVYAGTLTELYAYPPNEEIATFLGPVNCVPANQTEIWSGVREAVPRIARPEQLCIEPDENSNIVVDTARFAGSIAEATLRHESSGLVRTFLHRPALPVLQTGMRVRLNWLKFGCVLMLCSAVLALAGCDDAAEPRLPVSKFSAVSIPAEGRRLPAPRGVGVDQQGHLVVLDSIGRVLVYAEGGKVERKWFMPAYDVGRPEGVIQLRDGRYVVADTHYHRVVIFDDQGKVLSMFGTYGKEPGQFIYPVALAEDDQGDLYVAEYGSNDRIQKFHLDGTFLLQFGGFGTDPGQFQRPSGMVWSHAPEGSLPASERVYVADAFNNRLQEFTAEGKFLRILVSAETGTALHYPYSMGQAPNGDLIVIENGAGRLSRFTREGRLVGRYGQTGHNEGEFQAPWGVTADKQGRVYVADTGNSRVVELQP